MDLRASSCKPAAERRCEQDWRGATAASVPMFKVSASTESRSVASKTPGPAHTLKTRAPKVLQRGKGAAQISRNCWSMPMADTRPACAQTGGDGRPVLVGLP
jgi:hypothetical protein